MAWGLLFALCAVWSFSSPIMAGPDEPAHTIKAAGVVRGQLAGAVHEDAPTLRYFDVPDYISQLASYPNCFAMSAPSSATCVPDLAGSNDTSVPTDSSAGVYNPVYYLLVGWPSLLLENEAAIYGMRLASALLCSAVFASGIVAIVARGRSGWGTISVGVALTPMALFLGSSVNISGLEVASGFALAAWFAILVDPESKISLRTQIVVIGVLGVLLANTRSVGPVWLAVLAVSLLLDGRVWPRLLRTPVFWAAAVAIGLAGLYAVWWILSQGASEVRQPLEGAGETPFARGVEYMLANALEMTDGFIGVFGWLDARLPQTVISIWGGLMFAVVAAGILFSRGWRRIRVVALTVAFFVLPAIIQGAAWNTFGYIWQSRYILAIVLALLVTAGAALDADAPSPRALPQPRLAVAALFAGLAVMHVFALMWNLRRYVTGLDEERIRWGQMLLPSVWQPPLTWQGLAAADALLVALGSALLARLILRHRQSAAHAAAPSRSIGRAAAELDAFDEARADPEPAGPARRPELPGPSEAR